MTHQTDPRRAIPSPAPSTAGAPPPATELPDTSRLPRAPLYWAAFGAACLLFQTWVFARWAAGGNLHIYHGASYPVSGARKSVTWALTGVAFAGCVLMIEYCRRQSRAAGHVTLLTALLAGYFFTFWSDPYSGAVHHAVAVNRYGITTATWGSYLPGWHGPTPQLQSFVECAAYPWVWLWIWVGLAISGYLRRRFPGWSRARVAGATAVAALMFDIPLEQAYMRLGGYGYPRVLPHLTLFEGTYYQLPLSSPLCMVFLAVMPVVLMSLYARPGREVWFLEGTLRLPRRTQSWTRLLAGIGLANAAMLALQVVMLLCSLVSHPVAFPAWMRAPG